jgi:iron only hydrogenase large subunit-like protein
MTTYQFYHSHQIVEGRCKGRLNCIRACPTRALRLRNNKLVFLKNYCIDCGVCIQTCPEKVFVPEMDGLDETNRFEFQIAIPSPVLYTQFGIDVHPTIIRAALKKLGFDEVVDPATMIEEVAFALRHHLNTMPGNRPLISSLCPSIIRLIQVSYPNLINYLSGFDVPREIVAREAKKSYSAKLGIPMEKIGTVFISQCMAKVVSIRQPAEKTRSWIDSAISIKDIYNMLLPEIMEFQKTGGGDLDAPYYYGKGTGLYNRISQGEDPERFLVVTGIDHIKMIFDDIENAKLRNIDFIEPLACMQGCASGVFCVENPYIAAHTSIQLSKKYGKNPSFSTDAVVTRYDEGYYFMEHPVLPRPTRKAETDLATSIKRMRQKDRIFLKLPQKNCSLCGAPNCETFAEDCACGEAEITDCYFFK